MAATGSTTTDAPSAHEGPDGTIVANPEGTLAPVVFFFTWEREREDLVVLGRAMGPDQPLYGIDHPPIDGPLPRDLDEWVRFHRAGLDRLPVRAPYHLAGFSFGGVIALEIAMALRE